MLPTALTVCRSDLVVVGRSCRRLYHRTIDRTRSSARTCGFSGSLLSVRASIESHALLRITGRKLLVKTPPISSSALPLTCYLTVYVRDSLLFMSCHLLPNRQSRDTGTMASSVFSSCARRRAMSARLGCAGAPRSIGLSCFRSNERHASSVEFSAQISECREIVRTRLLRDSSHSCWKRSRSVRKWTSHRILLKALAEFERDFLPRFQGSSSGSYQTGTRCIEPRSICRFGSRSLFKNRCASLPTY